jgi:hypothetical protein
MEEQSKSKGNTFLIIGGLALVAVVCYVGYCYLTKQPIVPNNGGGSTTTPSTPPPSLSITPSTVNKLFLSFPVPYSPGSITVSGLNFSSNANISLTFTGWDGSISTQANSSGSFNHSVGFSAVGILSGALGAFAPSVGTNEVTATDATTGKSAMASYQVVQSI